MSGPMELYANKGSEMTQCSIESLREEIDMIDKDLVRLIAKRSEVAKRIGEIKAADGRGPLDVTRERAVIKSALSANQGPISDQKIERIFTEIISACRDLQANTKVSYLGPEGTFSHCASLGHFGASCEYKPAQSIPQVFNDVELGNVNYGVAPVENSTEGSVHATMDRLADTDLTVCGEILSPIRHCLMAKGADLETIKMVMSHPQALAQCGNRLRELLPKVLIMECPSTAKAAKEASENVSVAAVGSRTLATLYDLEVLEDGIQDVSVNLTRFVIIGNNRPAVTGNDKTSIMFGVPHKPGALGAALAALAHHGLNMSRIESRPSKRTPWEYVFFVDFLGHVDDPKVIEALKDMGSKTTKMKVLGSYPAALNTSGSARLSGLEKEDLRLKPLDVGPINNNTGSLATG